MWRNADRTKNRVLPYFQEGTSLIVFDTETTGLGREAKIIEFGGIRYVIRNHALVPTHYLNRYINPEEPLSDKIVELTGITDEMVADAGNESTLAPEIYQFLESADLWAAYNCQFDLRMLRQMEERTGLAFRERECLDILEMARDLIPKEDVENYKLSTVAGYLFPEQDVQFHSAAEDAKVTARCLSRFLSGYAGLEEGPKKAQARLEYASYSENPRQKSQKRIKLKLSRGEYGDIFWDVVNHGWGCKATRKARELFSGLDMKNIEQQCLNRYGWKYRASDMDSLASAWGKAKRASK